MNIRHISFDKVVMKSKQETLVCWNAMVRLVSSNDKMMSSAVVIDGYRVNNVQRPRGEFETNFAFTGWKLISFDSWNMKFKCKGAVKDTLVDFEVDCIYSLPLKDEE
jgi:hypothetical protein